MVFMLWWKRDVGPSGQQGSRSTKWHYSQLQQLTGHVHADHGWHGLLVLALALRHMLFSHSDVKKMTCNNTKLFLSLQTFCSNLCAAIRWGL